MVQRELYKRNNNAISNNCVTGAINLTASNMQGIKLIQEIDRDVSIEFGVIATKVPEMLNLMGGYASVPERKNVHNVVLGALFFPDHRSIHRNESIVNRTKQFLIDNMATILDVWKHGVVIMQRRHAKSRLSTSAHEAVDQLLMIEHLISGKMTVTDSQCVSNRCLVYDQIQLALDRLDSLKTSDAARVNLWRNKKRGCDHVTSSPAKKCRMVDYCNRARASVDDLYKSDCTPTRRHVFFFIFWFCGFVFIFFDAPQICGFR